MTRPGGIGTVESMRSAARGARAADCRTMLRAAFYRQRHVTLGPQSQMYTIIFRDVVPPVGDTTWERSGLNPVRQSPGSRLLRETGKVELARSLGHPPDASRHASINSKRTRETGGLKVGLVTTSTLTLGTSTTITLEEPSEISDPRIDRRPDDIERLSDEPI